MSLLGAAALGIGALSNIGVNASNNALNREQLAFQRYQYEDQKRYNSASAQVNRLRAAGLNPALVFGQDAGMVSSVSAPATHPMSPLDMSGLSSMVNSTELNDVERTKTQEEANLTHLKSFNQDLQNTLDSVFAKSERSNSLDLLQNKIKSEFNHALLLAAQGDYTKALESLSHAQEFNQYAQGGKYHQEMLQLQELLPWEIAKARSYINHLAHQNNALDAGAYLSRSQGNLNTLDYNIKSDPSVSAAIGQTYIETMNKLQSENKINKVNLRRASALADIAEKENDSYYWTLVYDELLKGGATVADLLTLRKKIAAFEGLSTAAQENAQTRSGRLAHDKDMDNNTYEHTDTYSYKNGKRVHSGQTRKGRVRLRK